jgi:hypothetical protein
VYIKNLTAVLEPEKADEFKKGVEGATKFLLSKLKDLQFFVGESMKDDATVVFAYYKDGATNPTFLYFSHGRKLQNVHTYLVCVLLSLNNRLLAVWIGSDPAS